MIGVTLKHIVEIIASKAVNSNECERIIYLNLPPQLEMEILSCFNDWLAPQIKEWCETRNWLHRYEPMADYNMFISQCDNKFNNWQGVVSGAIGNLYGVRSVEYDKMYDKLLDIILDIML